MPRPKTSFIPLHHRPVKGDATNGKLAYDDYDKALHKRRIMANRKGYEKLLGKGWRKKMGV